MSAPLGAEGRALAAVCNRLGIGLRKYGWPVVGGRWVDTASQWRDALFALGLNFSVFQAVRHPLARLTVRGPDNASINQRVQFAVSGVDSRGRTRTAPFAQWASLDTAIVVHDANGEFRTRASGRARLVVTHGPLIDTIVLTVNDRPARVAFTEDWRTDIASQWIDFGEPTPITARGALRPSGDSYLTSGVISRATIDARRGGGVHTRFRLPLNSIQWQTMSVALDYVASSDDLLEWRARRDGIQPLVWTSSRVPRSCSFSAPRGEGGALMHLVSFSAAGEGVTIPRVAPLIADGEWHDILLQIFDDGRCGLALDGVPVAISTNTLTLDLPLRVTLAGASVKTTVEIGPVEAWTGIRRDVDWSQLSAPRFTVSPRSPRHVE